MRSLKNSNVPMDRFYYAMGHEDWESLKNDEDPRNRLRCAELTGDWKHLENDKDSDNRLRYEVHMEDESEQSISGS